MNPDSPLDKLELTPINYFEVEFDLPSGRKTRLPDLSEFTREEMFADVSISWTKEGITLDVNVDAPPGHSSFPNVEGSDSVELYFDTRDIKAAGFNHKFCHHFVFLLEAVDSVQAAEVTRFRTEDSHPLCKSEELQVGTKRARNSYSYKIQIPATCLVGYDPVQFNRFGFSYRVNRSTGSPQHFTVASDEFQIDQNPSLWASMRLK